MNIGEELRKYEGQPITRQVLMEILRDYKRPADKIHELVSKELLTPVKRGVYIHGPALGIPAPEKMLLANHIWGPSYVSVDTALSYWGLIPERVAEITSMTTSVAKTYRTKAGRFRYIRLPLPYYSFGIQQVELSTNQHALIAGKEKAICDKIVTTPMVKLRSVIQTRQYLTEDLRIERYQLQELDLRKIQSWVKDAPKKESIGILLKTLINLL